MDWRSPAFIVSLTVIVLPVILYLTSRYFSGTMYRGPYPDLTGKFAIITGGNSGIGMETVKMLAQRGCNVLIGARDRNNSQKVISELPQLKNAGNVREQFLDLGDMDSIRQFVEKIPEQKVDFLINNAGVMGFPRRKQTKQGFEMHYGVNHLGHFYLTHLIWPKLEKAQDFRIINVSSLAHRKVTGFFRKFTLNYEDLNFEKEIYQKHLAYSRSKLCNVLFTRALAHKFPSKGLYLSLHPGVVRTGIMRHITDGPLGVLLNIVYFWFCIFTKSTYEGAQTTFYCLLQDREKLINGAYYNECRLGKESTEVNESNWNKLWEISERDCGIKFGQEQQIPK